MTDKVDDNDELEKEFNEELEELGEDFEEELEEEFDFDSDDIAGIEEPLTEDSFEAPPPQKPVSKPNNSSAKLLTSAIFAAIIGVVGYQGYSLFLKPKDVSTAKESTTPATNNTGPTNTIDEPKSVANAPMPSPFDTPSTTSTTPSANPKDDLGAFPDVDTVNKNEQPAANWFDEQIKQNESKPSMPSFNESKPATQAAPVISGVDKEELNNLESRLETLIAERSVNQNKRLSSIESDIAKLSQRIADINAQVGSVNANLNQITATINEFGSQVSKLTEVQEQKQERVKAQRAKQVQEEKKKQQAAPTMSLHAIIPGRAWLRSDDGQITSVTEGDTVGRYGKVLRIDANEGVVVTSSGVVLR